MIEAPDFTVIDCTQEDQVSSRTSYQLNHTASGRRFILECFAEGTSAPADMLRETSRKGTVFPSEFRPNGRFVNDLEGSTYQIPAEEWELCKNTPSSCLDLLARTQASMPGYEPAFWGGGFSSRSIFYKDIPSALRAISNAIEADLWLCDSEPIKKITLPFSRTEATLEAQALWGGGAPPCALAGALKSIAKAMEPSDSCEVSTHVDNLLRIDVTRASLAYPENCRLFLLCDTEGRFLKKGFVRDGLCAVGDQISGCQLSRFDDPAYIADGLPHYGQSLVEPDFDPARWYIEQSARCSTEDSDKVYFILRRGPEACVVWGKFLKGRFGSKICSHSEAIDRFYDRLGGRYERLRFSSEIPDILSRLEASGYPSQLTHP